MRALVLAVGVGLVACAPSIDGSVERQRTLDTADADGLARQLAALPGAFRAEATLHRPVIDPLTHVTSPGSAAILILVDDGADRAAVARAAATLVRGTAPEIAEPAIVVELGALRPQLVRVGPFTVEAQSRRRLVGALAISCAVIAALAAWIAWRERWRLSTVGAGYARGSSAQ